jgi:hypothetical protein
MTELGDAFFTGVIVGIVLGVVLMVGLVSNNKEK